MAPSSSEPSAMLVDTLSHPLSVLQEFARLGEAITPIVRWQTIEPGRIEMAFSFHGVGEPNAIETVVRLHSVPAQPRPMALVINGFRAERRVRLEDYALSWTAAGREVPIPDPMAALVGDFVRTVRDGETRDSLGRRMWRIQSRLKLLWMIMHRFPAP
jgi:hypothetical protein